MWMGLEVDVAGALRTVDMVRGLPFYKKFVPHARMDGKPLEDFKCIRNIGDLLLRKIAL